MKLNELTVTAALAGLRKKEFSITELVQACLDRIDQTDKKIHAFLTLNEKAIDQAKAMDKKWQDKPLFGIPFALKDNFLTQGLRTTASAKVLDDYIPQYNATVYQRLLDAGAILLGKTNMDAWAHGSSTETSDYGPTLNPWDTSRLPGGSSGGSAAAVIADMCIFAIGSETAGSIRQPAAWCGVTGFKPSYGRVSRYGVVAMASSTDSPGPIVKTVDDAAEIMKVIAGPDKFDATTNPKPYQADDLQGDSLKGKKIALPKEYLLKEMDEKIIQLIKAAADQLAKSGAEIEETSLIDPNYAIGVYTIVQRSEVSSNLGRYDGIRYGGNRSTFSWQAKAKNRSLLGTFALSTGYFDQYYAKAQKVRTLILNDFAKLYKDFDFYLAPTSPGPAQKLGAGKDNPLFGELEDKLVEASSIAGLPGLSLPCGTVSGLPIGLQLTGPQGSEAKVLSAGKVYQNSTKWHLERPKL